MSEAARPDAASGAPQPCPAAASPRAARDRVAELEAAIANLTRLLATVDDAKDAAELVAERRAMRTEAEALRREVAGVVSIDDARRRR